ncbi:SDR family NAD(P)-dependent oxidoreductase [Bordetella sp. N]|uniref:SDR family NAD(P)-dependent oxidoreductase n=1 Tax=Bordetella sp. N TaxID=1746199 RepID=UPI00070D0A6E|nr:SDR family NAD(P)-dependent oxidoreductase [Bordetella sp. N]ALM84222.1 hypothetical protein ASB57_15690 [Bordetella sp. N]
MFGERTVIITGGNAGLGFKTALRLARYRSFCVVIACRNADLGQKAVAELNEEGGSAIFLPIDLSDQASVHHFVDLICKANLPPLYGVICNAGMQNVAEPERTKEGYETTFAVNHLGHYLLVRLLLPQMSQNGRITFVSSGTHDPKAKTKIPPPIYKDAGAVARDFANTRSDGLRRYAMSKLCNLLCAYELQSRLKASPDSWLNSLLVNAVNPGVMPGTGLARTWPKPIQMVARVLLPLIEKDVQSTDISAERLVAVTLGNDAQPGGRYFSNGVAIRSSDDSYNKAFQRELWESSARMTGLPTYLTDA